MQLTRQRSLPVAPRVAWDALTDVNVLKACIPGCESLTAMSANQFMVTVVAGVGPIRATVKGHIELQRHGDVDPPTSYTLLFDGYGRFIGQARGEAYVHLQPHTDGSTVLRYGTKANVTGRFARAGAHFIDLAVQELAETFFARVSDHMRQSGN